MSDESSFFSLQISSSASSLLLLHSLSPKKMSEEFTTVLPPHNRRHPLTSATDAAFNDPLREIHISSIAELREPLPHIQFDQAFIPTSSSFSSSYRKRCLCRVLLSVVIAGAVSLGIATAWMKWTKGYGPSSEYEDGEDTTFRSGLILPQDWQIRNQSSGELLGLYATFTTEGDVPCTIWSDLRSAVSYTTGNYSLQCDYSTHHAYLYHNDEFETQCYYFTSKTFPSLCTDSAPVLKTYDVIHYNSLTRNLIHIPTPKEEQTIGSLSEVSENGRRISEMKPCAHKLTPNSTSQQLLNLFVFPYSNQTCHVDLLDVPSFIHCDTFWEFR